MGNIFTKTQEQMNPYIHFKYESEDKPFLKIFCNKQIGRKKELYIFYQDEIDPHKHNMTIWVLDNEIIDDFILYIKMIVNRINYAQKNMINKQIILGSNIGYTDTTFEFNDETGIFTTFTNLMSYITKIEVAKLGMVIVPLY